MIVELCASRLRYVQGGPVRTQGRMVNDLDFSWPIRYLKSMLKTKPIQHVFDYSHNLDSKNKPGDVNNS